MTLSKMCFSILFFLPCVPNDKYLSEFMFVFNGMYSFFFIFPFFLLSSFLFAQYLYNNAMSRTNMGAH